MANDREEKKINQEKRRRYANVYTKPTQSVEESMKQIDTDLQVQDRKKPSVKKTKKKVSKKLTNPKTKKPRKDAKVKPSKYDDDDTGIVLIDDDLEVDEQTELEERKAYLEEARSQESSD